MQIQESTFIVTGGASGLGEGTVRRVVDFGGRAVIADLKEVEGRALAQELGRNALFVRTDVTDEGSCRAAVDAAVKQFGGVQGLVGCAGIVHGEKVLGKEAPHSIAGFARTINVNLVGMFNMLRLAAEAMSKGTPRSGRPPTRRRRAASLP
jgi:NAD(P)-dependent dehydrogenase (short-subunit alcohol dehydrogenase family)